MKMDTRIFPDSDALSRAALDELLRIVSDAVKERGRFAIALAGGHTPAKLYQMWGQPEKRRDEDAVGARALILGRRAIRCA